MNSGAPLASRQRELPLGVAGQSVLGALPLRNQAQASGSGVGTTGSRLTPAPAGTWLARLGRAFADLLFPPHCVVCRTLGAWLCESCQAAIEAISPPVCGRCGLPLPALASDHYCPLAASSLAGVRAYALYRGPLREAIHQFKYGGLQSLATLLGEMMAGGWVTLAPSSGPVDAVVPVPLHPARQRERGFNQSACLARQLGAHLGWPVIEGVLVRTRRTVPQVGLEPARRQTNVAGAFQCVDGSLAGKRLLLIDDVRTTGSTLEAACLALHQGGAASVWAYTLACTAGRSSGDAAGSLVGDAVVSPAGSDQAYEKEIEKWT